MVFERTTGVYERIYRFNSKWVRKKVKYKANFWKMSNPPPIPCLRPPPPRPRRLNIDRCIIDKFPSSVHTTHLDLTCVHVAWRLGMTVVCVVVVYYYYYIFLPELLFPESWAFSPENFKFLKSWGRCLHPPPPGPYTLGLDSVACTMQWLSLFFIYLFFFWSSFVPDGPFNGRWC